MKKLLLVSLLFLAGAVFTVSASPLALSTPGSNDDCSTEMVLLDLELDLLCTGTNPWRGCTPFSTTNPDNLDRATIDTVLDLAGTKLGLPLTDMQLAYRDGNCQINMIGAGKYVVITGNGDILELVDGGF